MTTERIDICAVMDTARRDLQIAAEYKGMRSAGESAADMIKARAAVAELIEAANAYRRGEYHDPEVEFLDAYSERRREARERLDAALARVESQS